MDKLRDSMFTISSIFFTKNDIKWQNIIVYKDYLQLSSTHPSFVNNKYNH